MARHQTSEGGPAVEDNENTGTEEVEAHSLLSQRNPVGEDGRNPVGEDGRNPVGEDGRDDDDFELHSLQLRNTVGEDGRNTVGEDGRNTVGEDGRNTVGEDG
jgi:hypothetical protein